MDLNPELMEYITANIFPCYEKYYSHGLFHIQNVIDNMLMLSRYYRLDGNMAYTIACYHDLGLSINRENHEHESGKILKKDQALKQFFTSAQIKIMAEAIEDHRGSRKVRPRNIYGECVSDSDRDFDVRVLAKRQLATSLKNYPELSDFDEHFERCYAYICQRINSDGVFNLWTNNPTLVARRDQFQRQYLNKPYTKRVYRAEWTAISSSDLKEKILTYYEDY